MELDDFKTAWQILDRRLEQQSTLNMHIFKQGRLERMRSSLRPLFWGQLVQMLFGVAFILFATRLGIGKPDALAVILAGIVVHA